MVTESFKMKQAATRRQYFIYNHKRAKCENLFSYFASAVIIYPKTFANLLLSGIYLIFLLYLKGNERRAVAYDVQQPCFISPLKLKNIVLIYTVIFSYR